MLIHDGSGRDLHRLQVQALHGGVEIGERGAQQVAALFNLGNFLVATSEVLCGVVDFGREPLALSYQYFVGRSNEVALVV